MVRLLVPGDEARLDAFLLPLTDTSMFLRANLRAGGLVFEGERLQGTYAGAFRGTALVGVAAHWWNGLISLQAPEVLDGVVREVAALSNRPISGLAGPLEQVRRAQQVLELSSRPANLDSVDVLYTLELTQLRVPRQLQTGQVTVRRARPEDEAILSDWHHDFCVEALGDAPGAALRESANGWVRSQTAAGTIFVAEEHGQPVSMAAFNASLPDCVQLGGVWTPVPRRGRGLARAVTAGALQLAVREGVTRSVLFTQETNTPARRAYEAIGFVDSGRFALALYGPR